MRVSRAFLQGDTSKFFTASTFGFSFWDDFFRSFFAKEGGNEEGNGEKLLETTFLPNTIIVEIILLP